MEELSPPRNNNKGRIISPPALKNKPTEDIPPTAKRIRTGILKNVSFENKQPANPYKDDIFMPKTYSRLKAGRKKNSNPDKITYLRIRTPVQVESVNLWNEATDSAIKVLNATWKTLLAIDPMLMVREYNSTERPIGTYFYKYFKMAETKNNCWIR